MRPRDLTDAGIRPCYPARMCEEGLLAKVGYGRYPAAKLKTVDKRSGECQQEDPASHRSRPVLSSPTETGVKWFRGASSSLASVVNAPWARSREKQIKEGKAEQDRSIAHIVRGKEALLGVHHEIGDRHHSAEDERNRPG